MSGEKADDKGQSVSVGSSNGSATDASRLRFLRTLDGLDEPARAHLLRVETEGELAQLWDIAMCHRMTGVAASIEEAAKKPA